MFGEEIKELRLNKNLSLRAFCKAINYDPSNWSKIERGIINPPQEEELLNKIQELLEISNEEWERIKDSMYVSMGSLPPDCLEDKELLESLPLFLRTVKNTRPTKEQIANLINLIKSGI